MVHAASQRDGGGKQHAGGQTDKIGNEARPTLRRKLFGHFEREGEVEAAAEIEGLAQVAGEEALGRDAEKGPGILTVDPDSVLHPGLEHGLDPGACPAAHIDGGGEGEDRAKVSKHDLGGPKRSIRLPRIELRIVSRHGPDLVMPRRPAQSSDSRKSQPKD